MSSRGDLDELAIENFQRYLRIRTVQPNPDYESCMKFLNEMADSLKLQFNRVELKQGKPIGIITWKGLEPSLSSIMLNSHTDVVPVFPDMWDHDPFGADLVEMPNGEKRIYARGSQDMKIVGICYVEAIRRLIIQGKQLRRTIHLVFVPEEEIGGEEGMKIFLESKEFKDLNVGFVLDEGIANPSDHLRVFNSERAPWWMVFRAHGNTGHGSQFIENTAMEKLIVIINEMMNYRKAQLQKLHDSPSMTLGEVDTVNLTIINGGVQQNVVPEFAEACFDMRVSPKTNTKKLMAWLKQLATTNGADLSFKSYFPDSLTTPIGDANPWWMAFSKALSDCNLPFQSEIFPASTDSRYVRAKNIPSLGISPLRRIPILLHDHNEYVTLELYFEGIAMYECLIKEIANVV